jgi:hypothetical protein
MLTANTDVLEGTANNDTFTATQASYQTSDVIIGNGGNDTLNVALNAAPAGTATVVGVENVNFDVTSFSDVTINAADIVGTGTTITVNNLQAGGTANADIDNVETGATVVAGTGVTGALNVEADGAVTINGGSATSVVADLNNVTTQSSITANSATTVNVANADDVSISSTSATGITVEGDADTNDAAKLSAKNASATSVVSLDIDGTGADVVEVFDLSGNGGAVTYDLNADVVAGGTAYTFTGDQDVTLVGTSAQFTGDTVTDSTTAGTTTLKIDVAAATADLGKVSADVIDVAHTNAQGISYDLKNSATVKLSATAGAAVTLASDELSSGDETLSVIAAADQTSDIDVSDFETVNLSADDGKTSTATITLSNLIGTAATNGVVNVSGADNLILSDANATHLNAAAMTGKLTTTLAADLKKVTGGTGDDIINAADVAFVVDGGAGTDTFNIASGDLDLSGDTISMSNVEIIAIDAAGGASDDTLTVDSSFITGKSFIVTGTDNSGANDVLAVKMVTNPSLDLGSLTVDGSDVSVTIDLTATAGVANTITGSNAGDTITNAGAGAVTVNGGAGDDTLNTGSAADSITGGEGADQINGNGGKDAINLTEATAATDIVTIDSGESTVTAYDSITGFAASATNGDVLNLVDTSVESTATNTNVSSATADSSDTITASTNANGIITLGGANAANVDTLDEWIEVAKIMATSENIPDTGTTNSTVYATVGFEFGGNTYVLQEKTVQTYDSGTTSYSESTTVDAFVELVGVTGVTAISTTAAANTIDIA